MSSRKDAKSLTCMSLCSMLETLYHACKFGKKYLSWRESFELRHACLCYCIHIIIKSEINIKCVCIHYFQSSCLLKVHKAIEFVCVFRVPRVIARFCFLQNLPKIGQKCFGSTKFTCLCFWLFLKPDFQQFDKLYCITVISWYCWLLNHFTFFSYLV